MRIHLRSAGLISMIGLVDPIVLTGGNDELAERVDHNLLVFVITFVLIHQRKSMGVFSAGFLNTIRAAQASMGMRKKGAVRMRR